MNTPTSTPDAAGGFAAPHGSLAIPSVKILLAQMMEALDAGDSEKYWACFEAMIKRHEDVIAEVGRPENSEVRGGGPLSNDNTAEATRRPLH